MAQIRNYQKGIFETKSLAPISQVTDSTNTFLQFDGILTNAFSNLVLYADAGGASPLPITSYEPTTTDDTATALEAETSTGGSGYTVYSQFEVTDATYQNVDLWATFTNFGTYTDNDAPFDRIGVELEIASSQTVELSSGSMKTFIGIDTTLGNVTCTLPDGDFYGQQCFVYRSAGTGLGYLKDVSGDLYQGASSLGIPITLKCLATWVPLGWVADNEITADYVSGDWTVEQSSNGKLVQKYLNRSVGASASAGYTFPVANESSLGYTFDVIMVSNQGTGAPVPQKLTASTASARNASSGAESIDAVMTGKY